MNVLDLNRGAFFERAAGNGAPLEPALSGPRGDIRIFDLAGSDEVAPVTSVVIDNLIGAERLTAGGVPTIAFTRTQTQAATKRVDKSPGFT